MESLIKEVIFAQNEDELYARCLQDIYSRYQPNHCFIAEYDLYTNVANTLHYLINGVSADSISYSLVGSPCEQVLNDKRICAYPSQIQQRFPEDIALQHLNAESYVGIPLQSSDGAIVGVLALLFDDRLTSEPIDNDWLLTIGFLVGKSILQHRLTRQKNTLLRQLQRSEQITQSCSWRWDVEKDKFKYSNNLGVMFDLNTDVKLSFYEFFNQYVFKSHEQYKQLLTSECAHEQVVTTIIHSEESKCHIDLEITYSKHFGPNGALTRIEGNVRNISDLSELVNDHLIAQRVIELSSSGVILTDANNLILNMNSKAEDITGYRLDEMYGLPPSTFSSDIHDRKFYKTMWQSIELSDCWSGEVWNKTKSGAIYPEQLSIHVVRGRKGDIQNYIAIFDDLSYKKSIENELLKYRNKQDFTGLMTRTKFIQMLEDNPEFAVLLVDISRFSEINNLYGEEFGNKVLSYVGQILYANYSAEKLNICRYGADQFALAWNLANVSGVEQLVSTIRATVEEAFSIDGTTMNLAVNMGYSLPIESTSETHPLTKAYYALEEAKSQLTPGTIRYSDYLEQRAERKHQLGAMLKQALDEERLHVEYQPIYDLQTRTIVKFEALARWVEGNQSISPFEFIPIAEELGYISQLGNLILKKVCKDILSMKALGFDEIVISVNRSIEELLNEEIDNCSILSQLEESGLSTRDVIIEITESIPLEDKPQVQDLLDCLRKRGLKLALDDFGTGFASFSNLMKNTVDLLKIDRSFIRDIESDKNNAVLVESVNMLASQLGLEVIAEGVETKQQLELLQSMGCRYIQGYYISKPVPFDKAMTLLEKYSEHSS
ncbi:GGDEF/EAL domain-containing protein [Vibrio orientalis CIP 102891 = ATCC 33934]|uniref:GGDEF/EAL domain-containing protein n=1 Tax=Vibrio orientalis CIP 102891 = ATCC 33934 TaxID=675816 RepID=C9QKQ6_VIBOR|nr:EAL domain-containing protein [Vibrio orientalis]EEX92391.1 sensory box sensor/GGDEF/EAL domain protein [Vibrio orientalis CIP 102891 = ATCC 33934]EGU48972.1 GGDEF/EAL domain-containing protein [Vibrio orientalis CIP 102891 = ATCC 33934]